MAGTFTPYIDNMVQEWLWSSASTTRPTAWYVALHTGANGGSGASNEIVGNGYARQAVTFSISTNVASNSGALAFGPDVTANWGTVTDVTIWDSLTSGNCLAQGTVTSPVAYAIGDTATIAIGALTITLT